METIEKSILVQKPLDAVYDQWTRFEEFPQFMEGVKNVQEIAHKRLHWVAEIAGKEKQWDAEIFDQVPGQRIAWRSTRGAKNSGMVTFAATTPNQTRVSLRLSYDPEGIVENLGDMLGLVSARVAGDLNRFKEFMESGDKPATGQPIPSEMQPA